MLPIRLLVLTIVIAATVAGCQSTGVYVPMTPQQASQANLHPNGGIAVNGDGQIYLTTASTLMRYDVEGDTLTDLLVSRSEDLRDVAFTKDDVALVLQSDGLSAYVAGQLMKAIDLPGEPQAVSCNAQYAYIQTNESAATAAVTTTSRLLRYGLESHRLETMATMGHRLNAIAAVPGGCLVAAGGNVFKVTDPSPVDRQVTVVLLFAIQGPITSLVADVSRKAVYVADKDMTYAWADGSVIPFFPCGGRLAWSKDTLSICDPATGQIVQVRAASKQVDQLAKGGPLPK